MLLLGMFTVDDIAVISDLSQCWLSFLLPPVVEVLEGSASLHGCSIQQHHVCMLVKETVSLLARLLDVFLPLRSGEVVGGVLLSST